MDAGILPGVWAWLDDLCVTGIIGTIGYQSPLGGQAVQASSITRYGIFLPMGNHPTERTHRIRGKSGRRYLLGSNATNSKYRAIYFIQSEGKQHQLSLEASKRILLHRALLSVFCRGWEPPALLFIMVRCFFLLTSRFALGVCFGQQSLRDGTGWQILTEGSSQASPSDSQV